MLDATKAAGAELASRAKQVGAALAGASVTAATAWPAALSIYINTLLTRQYWRPRDEGAAARDDYGKVPSELTSSDHLPPWLLPVSVETWNHILDGHAPESTDLYTDKFADGRTEAIVAAILEALEMGKPRLRDGDVQDHYSTYNGQKMRFYIEYIDRIGKWELTSFHPYPGDPITDFFKSRS